ncbi:hypothetical protein OSH11_10790 [Kaistia dalseonensis]|uniref:CopG family transcriptional regulator n=1 Tax=Kaistia dalseonensis TaxID=410840 RepID=A0ABU0H643_9HYPH|nr:hypothetical protein [Kaistia dalseonensis]MCX5495193.1 hypothetical protein [Kaistia dalseonensis]MDQ0437778.1 hypothetical protein [Kaistia dalseonensis]
MKNVTITLDETVAQWARVEAAKAGMSLSRWIGMRLSRERDGALSAASADDWLDTPLWPSADLPLPKRAELYESFYDRPGFRGYERPDLQSGSTHAGQGEPVSGLAEDAPESGWAGAEPSGSE